jgi:hypothetical protein
MTNLTMFPLLLLAGMIPSIASFQQTQRTGNQRMTRVEVQHVAATALFARSSNEELCDPCQEPASEDVTLDRREAAFAMLGTIWAAGAIPTALIFPDAANAAYGVDAKLLLPNPVESINDRVTKQCLVESLGNRECLVYASDEDTLYQGADTRSILERIDKASAYLASIPELVERKKWSQVTGVLAGPMGELIRNMGQLADLSENAAVAKTNVKRVKTDLYAMQAFIVKKDGEKILELHAAATQSLVVFVKSL